MESRTITVIPKKVLPKYDFETGQVKKKRVCAYARVSTDLEDQKNSFNAQLDYYKEIINKNENWDFVNLYSDEGISGTSIKKREGFKRMIDDALGTKNEPGKIDLILTKSISRFARNTVDCLKTVRDLRSKNVTVFFEKENISTDDPKIEMMLTIFASMAQEESKSISENVKWGIRKRMQKGVTHVRTESMLGFDTNEKGQIIINEEEAKIVKQIFNLYLAGYSYREICNYLEENNIRTGTNRSHWTVGNIYSILGNEKYCGEVILQKTVIVDFLSHKAVKNDGIEEKYLISNHHEGFINKQVFEYVQQLRTYYKDHYSVYMNSNVNMVAGILICENCLRPLYKIKQHPNSKYERLVFTCKNVAKNKEEYIPCDIKGTVDYETLLKATIDVFNKYFEPPKNMNSIIVNTVTEAKQIDKYYLESTSIKLEIEELENQLKAIIKEQLESTTIDNLETKFQETKDKIKFKKKELQDLANIEFAKYEAISSKKDIEDYLKDTSCITPLLLRTVIKKIIRKRDGSLRFVLSDTDIEITQNNKNLILSMPPIYKAIAINGAIEIPYDVIKMEAK